jgi:hypothetical protein
MLFCENPYVYCEKSYETLLTHTVGEKNAGILLLKPAVHTVATMH